MENNIISDKKVNICPYKVVKGTVMNLTCYSVKQWTFRITCKVP